jgi:succinate dehydrogenase/fumarate reductase cytochrome b subunit
MYTTRVFWERLWRMSGINFVVFFIIAYVIYGSQPQVGASAEELAAFYDGDRTRILIAAVVAGLAVLNLLWFAAALRTTVADAGQGGWGAAATASSAAVGGLFLWLSRWAQPSRTRSPAPEIARSHRD